MPAGRSRDYRIPVSIDPKGAVAGRKVVSTQLQIIQRQAVTTRAAISRLSRSLGALGASSAVSNNLSAVNASLGQIAASSLITNNALKNTAAGMQTANNAGNRLATGAGNAAGGISRIGVSSSRALPIVRTFGIALGGLGIAIGGGIAIAQIAKFEEAMASVRAVVGATGDEFEHLSSLARHLGAVTTFTATEAGNAELSLARAGLSTNEILLALPDTLQLARAGMLGLQEATDIAVSTLRGFGLSAEETGRVTDVLALTAARTNTTIAELSEGLKFVAPVASQIGVSFEETAAALGKLADAGLKSTLGGTGLRRVLSGLANPTSAARRIFAGFGLTLQDLSVETFGVASVLGKLGDAGIDAGQSLEVFGLRGGPAFLVLKGLEEETAKLNKQLQDASGFAQQTAEIMDNTLSAAFKRLNSAVTESFLQFGDNGLKGSLRGLVETSTGVLTVWNDMIPAMAAAGDITDENIKKFENWAFGLELTGVALRGLIVAGSLVFLGRMLIAVAGVAAAMSPFTLALTALTTALSLASYFYDTHAEKLETAINRYNNLENSLRNVAGAANFTNRTFGNLEIASRDRYASGFEFEQQDYGKLALEVVENIGDALANEISRIDNRKFYENPNAGIPTIDDIQREGKLIASALEASGIATDGNVSSGELSNILKTHALELKETPAEFARVTENFVYELKQRLNPLISAGESRRFAQNTNAAFSSEIGGQFVDLRDIIARITGAGRNVEDLRNPTDPADIIRKQTQPSILGELLQLEKFDASGKTAQLEALELKRAGGRFGYDIEAQARLSANREANTRFAGIPQSEDGQFDIAAIRETITNYLDSENQRLQRLIQIEADATGKDSKQTQALVSELAGINQAGKAGLELAPELQGLRSNFVENLTSQETETGLARINDEFSTLKTTFDGIGAAQFQLDKVEALLRAAPDAAGIDVDKTIANLTEQFKNQLQPLESLIDAELEQVKQITTLTAAERDLIAVEQELGLIKETNQSITETELAITKQQVLAIRQLGREKADYQNLLRSISGDAFTAEQANIRTGSIEKASQQGEINPLQAAQQQAQLRLNSPLGDNSDGFQQFTDGFLANLTLIEESAIPVAERIGEAFQGAVNIGIEGFSNIAAEAIVTGESASEAFRALGQTIITSIIQSLIQIGVQYVVNAALAAVFGKAQVAANVAGTTSSITAIAAVTGAGILQGQALTAAYTPAAVAAAIASFGAANAFGVQAALLIAGSGIAGGASSGIASTGGAGINPGVGLADGGLISGPGGPRSDSIPIRASNGEFVVNAEATKRNLPLLEAINGMGYASGGQVTGGGGGNNVTLDIKVNNQTPDPVRIEQRQDNTTGQIVLTIKEALSGGVFDDELEAFGVGRQPD